MNNDLISEPSIGTSLRFDRVRTYGFSTPETGNFSLARPIIGNLPGVVQLVKHNSGTEPTFDTQFKKLSGTYEVSVVNYIYFEYISENEILYTISQVQ